MINNQTKLHQINANSTPSNFYPSHLSNFLINSNKYQCPVLFPF